MKNGSTNRNLSENSSSNHSSIKLCQYRVRYVQEGTIQVAFCELIFMKFAQLVRVYTWVNPVVFGNNWHNKTSDMGENMPPKTVFGIHSADMFFF